MRVGSWLINNQIASGKALILSGPVNLSSVQLSFNGSGSTVISGSIANGGLGLNGPGLMTFSGAGANTYSGTTNISGGELDLNKTAGVDAIGGNLSIVSTGTVKLLASNQIKDTSTVTMSGGAFITTKGKKILFINSRNKEVAITLPEEAKGKTISYVDMSTGETSPAQMQLNDKILKLTPFEVAVVSME